MMLVGPEGFLVATARLPRPRVAALLSALVVVALVLLMVDGGAPRLLHVLSPPGGPSGPGGASGSPEPPTGGAAHRMLRGAPGTLEAVDPAYRATFDARGFRYLPTKADEPLSISLAHIARGAVPIDIDRGAWAGKASVAERHVAPGIVERVSSRSGSVEWDVVLTTAPAGRGDFTITGSLSGVADTTATTTDDGRPAVQLRLAGGSSVTVDEVVVKDATGVVLFRALPTVTPDGVVLGVPARVLDGARYPLTVDPTLAGPAIVAPSGNRSGPSVAFDGSRYFVVWHELVAGQYDIYGTFVSADLTTVATPQRLSFRADNETSPDVAWNGSTFLVVWSDQFTGTDYDIRGQRVINGPQGGEVFISVSSSVSRRPAVSAGAPNSDFLVTFDDSRDGDTEAFAARVNPATGTVREVSGIRLSENNGDTDTFTDVAWNGTRWLVVWQNFFNAPGSDTSILAQSVEADGTTPGRPGNAIALRGKSPRAAAIASDGIGWLVAWDQDGASGRDVVAARVPDNFFWYTGEELQVGVANDDQTDPAVAYNGEYLVTWRDRRAPPDPDVYAGRVNSDGDQRDGTAGFLVRATTAYEEQVAVTRGPAGKWGISYKSGTGSAMEIHLKTAAK